MKYTILLASGIALFASCTKHNTTNTIPPFNKNYELTSSPEALSIYDSSNYGIYKGVVINAGDSTATFKLNINNNSSHPYGYFYADHRLADSLIRYMTDTAIGFMRSPQVPETSTIALNKSFYSYFASFRLGYGPIVGFNVKANGSSPVMNVVLYSNQTLDAILKERSNNQVYCFEGSYSGSDSGRIAFVISADSVIGIRASIWNPQFFPNMTGKVSNGGFVINENDGFVFTGSIQNNICSGTWTKNSNPGSGNKFSTRRTL